MNHYFATPPSFYDLASFVICVIILLVVIGIHLRQMKHARKLAELEGLVNVLLVQSNHTYWNRNETENP